MFKIFRLLFITTFHFSLHLPARLTGCQPNNDVLHLEVDCDARRTFVGILRRHAILGRLPTTKVMNFSFNYFES